MKQILEGKGQTFEFGGVRKVVRDKCYAKCIGKETELAGIFREIRDLTVEY
jgi:hypothetical protein